MKSVIKKKYEIKSVMKIVRALLHKFLAVLALISMAISCAPVKNIAYFQDKAVNSPEKIDMHGGIVIQPKDMISIVVSCRNPELATMFNLPVISYQAGSEIVSAGGQQRLMGYVVDNDGFIDFPILGKLSVMGMTRWQLSETIKDMLSDKGYVNDAVVTVEFMNFKVSVIGEVARPGTYTVEGDKVNVLQALSLAGDLTIFGKRENVTVIREQDGKRVFYNVDLCSAEMFKSPGYNLQQNDIIYVEPSEVRARQSTVDDKGMRMTSILISSGSLLVSVATLLATLIK